MSMHHTVTLLPPMWGHTVGYLHLVVQLLNAEPTLVMTIVQHKLMVPNMEKELSACKYDTKRLRLIGVGDEHVKFDPNSFEVPFTQLLMGWMATIPVLVAGSLEWPSPQTIHFDFTVGGPVFAPTKAIVGPDVKTVLWYCSNGAAMYVSVSEYDFAAIFDKIWVDEKARAGRSKEELQLDICEACNGSDKLTGEVVKILGVPDMYDYERISLAAGPPVWHWPILTSGQTLAKGVDGFIAATGAYIEPVGVPFLQDYYQKRGQTFFTVGPQTHDKYFKEDPPHEPITNEVVRTFLDSAYATHGENSVLYISFGSLFFPVANTKHVEALIDILLVTEPAFPFVFALGSNLGQTGLSQEFIDRVNASGKGLIATYWVEQRAILQHQAVGWFLTHGGFNSITEALTLGMPMIIWPAGAEQPGNAAYFSSEPHPVAFEFMQIRTAAQIGPSLRFGDKLNITGTIEDAIQEFEMVLGEARGEKGMMLRAHAQGAAKLLRYGRGAEAAAEIKRLAIF
ncbi:hypothetical protein MIND_00121900 [Mycena indigotica]|uniref:Glycosyltransferase family 1 protein n=1 Tax=Mycena indigotica TaxID=2126181 RepID=A0A8H6TFZ2_9AGAR|nr:uncharacterized protein MIND_00121900 [Mycena indigotica]KAF7316042.1 hypothetical protein MIND_00121900 [Mycena indigotica]